MHKLIFIVLAVIISVGGFFLRQKISESQEVSVINITDNGFSPAEIKIKSGSSVRFVNKSKKWHWPASDLHPSHNLYPEFDPKKAIGPGEEWSFTFDKAGGWGFHDHLGAYLMGKVLVEP